MAQQMITLEEAAERLGISPEEMKKRLKTDPDFKKLSQIRDGATLPVAIALAVTAALVLAGLLHPRSVDALERAEG